MQTPEETLAPRAGSCRDTRVAAGAGAAPSRPRRRASCRATSSSSGPTWSRSTGRPAQRRTSPICTPGPRSTFRAPAGSGSTPTSGLLCGGRAYSARGDAALPLRGADHAARVEPAEVEFSFDMRVTRIAEKPRVTWPFSDEAWAALDALGEKVDADLAAQDVRLTMGGEPTFVSVDDYQSAEWNTAALGPDQARPRRRPDPPAARPLRARRAAALRPGQMVSGRAAAALGVRAVLAPRRQADLARRRADRARERRRTLLPPMTPSASPSASPRGSASTPSTCSRPSRIRPSACSRKASCRTTSIPAIPRSTIRVERARIMRSFERRLGAPAGYVLPVQRWTAHARARLDQRAVADCAARRLFLMPAIPRSASACRSIRCPTSPPVDYPHLVPADPFAERGELARSGADGAAIAHRGAARRPRQVADFGRGKLRPTHAYARRRPPAFRCAPRSRSSRATGGCACSCRRSSGWRTISSCSPPSKRPRPSSACRSTSKATCRRPIRASTSSR